MTGTRYRVMWWAVKHRCEHWLVLTLVVLGHLGVLSQLVERGDPNEGLSAYPPQAVPRVAEIPTMIAGVERVLAVRVSTLLYEMKWGDQTPTVAPHPRERVGESLVQNLSNHGAWAEAHTTVRVATKMGVASERPRRDERYLTAGHQRSQVAV